MKGEIQILINDELYHKGSNLIVYNSLKILTWFMKEGNTNYKLRRIYWGSSNTPVDYYQTGLSGKHNYPYLVNNISYGFTESYNERESPKAGMINFYSQLVLVDVNLTGKTLAEVGLYAINGTTDSYMFSRAVFTPIVKSNNMKIDLKWTIYL